MPHTSSPQLAADCLIRAFRAGYDDLDWVMRDTDFDAVKEDPVFEVLFDSLTVIREEQQAALGSIRHVESTVLLNCFVQIPEDYDEETARPLIVGLHGYGSSPDAFIQLWERFDNPDFIYASPQAPYPFSMGNRLGYSWENRELEDEELFGRAYMATLGYIISTVEMLKGQFNVSDVYLLGFSQGCAATYITGIKYHDMFNGLICFGGWPSNNAKLLIEELEVDCIIVKGYQTFDADTVFLTDEMSISAVAPENCQ